MVAAAEPELFDESQLYLDPLGAASPARGLGWQSPDREAGSVDYNALIAEGRQHPKIVQMIGHWRDLAPAPGVLPGRQHFDPIRIPAMLPNIWLLDVVREARVRYRARLIGGALVDAGAPMRPGVFLDELGDRVDQKGIEATFEAVAREREPNWRRGKPTIRHARYISNLERVFLPFATDGKTVDLIMGFTVFYRGDGEVI